MELSELCTKLKFEHLSAQLDTLCEQAAKRELNYREFLGEALGAEWQGRRLKGVERGLRLACFPYLKTLEHSFHTLLSDLATLAKNRILTTTKDSVPFDLITTPTAIQQRAFDLLRLNYRM